MTAHNFMALSSSQLNCYVMLVPEDIIDMNIFGQVPAGTSTPAPMP